MSPGRLLDLWGITDESFEAVLASLDPRVRLQHAAGRRQMLGDRFVARPDFVSTSHAASVAPVPILWSWLAQMMRGAGIYGWERLEDPKARSSRRLVEGVPPPLLGDRVDDLLEVCALDEGFEVVWKNTQSLEFHGAFITEVTLDYRVEGLRPVGSRLIARIRGRASGHSPSLLDHVATTLSFILPRSQVRAIAGCADVQHETGRPALTAAEWGSRFQRSTFIPADGTSS